MGICCMTQGTQTGALWQSRGVGGGGGWEGGSGGREHGCTYDWFLLLFDRKQQNSVKQLPFNYKTNLKKRVHIYITESLCYTTTLQINYTSIKI